MVLVVEVLVLVARAEPITQEPQAVNGAIRVMQVTVEPQAAAGLVVQVMATARQAATILLGAAMEEGAGQDTAEHLLESAVLEVLLAVEEAEAAMGTAMVKVVWADAEKLGFGLIR